jgi:uncharacterized membrane protein
MAITTAIHFTIVLLPLLLKEPVGFVCPFLLPANGRLLSSFMCLPPISLLRTLPVLLVEAP